MLKTRKRWISLFITLTFLLAVMVPMGGPAFAKSVNDVNRVLSVSDTFVGLAATLTVKEHSDFPGHFVTGDRFRLTLPSGVKWNNPSIHAGDPATLTKISDQVVDITFTTVSAVYVDAIDIDLDIKVDGATGDIAVTIDPLDSAVTGGTVVFARVGVGKTTAVAESVKKIGKSGTGGTIRIDETSVGAIGDDAQKLTLKLPGNFVWNGMAAGDITFAGGFAGTTVSAIYGNGTRTLEVTFDPPNRRTQRGTIYVTPKIKAEAGASFGEITVTVGGDKITEADVVVAEYVDWGVTVKVKEVKELVAGKFDGVKTAKITIEENVPGSLLAGRDVNVKLPDWVKITDVDDFTCTGGNLAVTAPTWDGKKSEIDIPINTASSGATGKIEFTLDLSIQGNQSGDIEAVVSGAGVAETKVVIAKAVAPVDVTANVADVRIGVQGQTVPDLVITEGKAGAIELTAEMTAAGTAGEITLTLPTGVRFAATPKVQVTSGDLEVKADQARLTDSDTVFRIPVKSESIKASSLTVSGIKLTLDRTVPEGDLFVRVGGSAIIENSRSAVGWVNDATAGGSSDAIDAGEFDVGSVAKVKLANVITAAPPEVTGAAVFKIGEAKYTVNGEEKTMDVAAYTKDGRTFLPVRFAANAVGVSDANILWDGATQKVTIFKGDRVVQMTIGSKVLVVNGVSINMDVAPETVSGRTMLPIRFLAQALGADIQWNPETQEVTINF